MYGNMFVDKSVFYAFIESIDFMQHVGLDQNQSNRVVIWFDLIEKDYFNNLDWIHEKFNADLEGQRMLRRERIASMDRNNFLVGRSVLLIENNDEEKIFDEIQSQDWHLISLNFESGHEIELEENFEEEGNDRDRVFFEYLGPASSEENQLLYGVFNVDFIPELDFDDRGDGNASGMPSPILPTPSLEDLLAVDDKKNDEETKDELEIKETLRQYS